MARPRIHENELRVLTSMRVSPKTMKIIKQLMKSTGLSRSQVVDLAVTRYYAQMKNGTA